MYLTETKTELTGSGGWDRNRTSLEGGQSKNDLPRGCEKLQHLSNSRQIEREAGPLGPYWGAGQGRRGLKRRLDRKDALRRPNFKGRVGRSDEERGEDFTH